ncbi:MAG: hypothetical protein ABEK12_03705, partial [Candidatus Nanohaloarchaea archaeon]
LIIGHVLPSILNPSRWSVPNGMFVFGLGVLALIWIRYEVERHDIVPAEQLRYVVPGTTLLGALLVFLSPLYSQTIAGYMQSVLHKALQSGSAVVASTVAENQPASAGQIVGQLGAANARAVLGPWAAPLTGFVSGWTFAVLGTALLAMLLGGMLLRKYAGVDHVSSRVAYLAYIGSLVGIVLFLFVLIPGSAAVAYLFALIVGISGVGLFLLFPPDGSRVPPRDWTRVIPLIWIVSTIFGASQKSRLLFLASHPVALVAGYGLSAGIAELRRSAVVDGIADRAEQVDARTVFLAAVAIIMVPVAVFNGAAAYAMAQNVGGSPNQAWMENLEFMREETPADSVVLSWWDYGYWFETIGGRAAIADGGNMQFYNDAPGIDYKIINWPLADFLTASNYTAHMDWLQDLSVDYVVLDSSMIGKYSAVSTIANRGSGASSMLTASCRTDNRDRCITRRAENRTYLQYINRRSGLTLLAPVARRGGAVVFDGTPIVQTGKGSRPVANICTSAGIVPVAPDNASTVPGCVAFHPYRQHQTLVY